MSDTAITHHPPHGGYPTPRYEDVPALTQSQFRWPLAGVGRDAENPA